LLCNIGGFLRKNMTMTKTKVKKAVKQAKKIEVAEEASELHEVAVDEDEEETAAPAAEELDPEILKALNASKRKKKPPQQKTSTTFLNLSAETTLILAGASKP